MKNILIIFLLFHTIVLFSQNSFIGNYQGYLNGDNVSLQLESTKGNALKGIMKDSENTYTVTGTWDKNNFQGRAVEQLLGIEFEMLATLSGSILHTDLTFDLFGLKQKMEIQFQKANTNATVAVAASDIKNPVSTKSRDPEVIGVWTHETNYSSGYSFNDTYGSMSSRETMVFLSDGRMADGGSSTVIGGSNYSGKSSDQGGNIMAGVFWYTEKNKIYLHITDGGQTQTVELGKYYVENGRMLITGTNGEKLLLTKQ